MKENKDKTQKVSGETKIISISSKRQITIPCDYFEELGFEDAAECTIRDGGLVLAPAKKEESSAYTDDILADLLKQGYSGDKLLFEFTSRRKKQVRVREIEDAVSRAENDIAAGRVYTLDEVKKNAKKK